MNHRHVVAKAMARLVANGICRHTLKNGKPAIEMTGAGNIEAALNAECEKIAIEHLRTKSVPGELKPA